MMGLSGWCGSVMRMPTLAEAIASSRTRRTSRTAFNDRRDGGLGEALLTDHLHPIQIARQFIHAIPNLGGIALFGGLLERGADLGGYTDEDPFLPGHVSFRRHFVTLIVYSWIAFSRIAFLIGLVRWAVHPASRLFRISSCKANAESAMIGVGGRPISFSHCLIFLVAA